jgi:hypothetical protein
MPLGGVRETVVGSFLLLLLPQFTLLPLFLPTLLRYTPWEAEKDEIPL